MKALLIVFFAQAMMAAPILLPIFFAGVFAFSMVVLIIGSWVARILGFVKGDISVRKFSHISAVFAIVSIAGFLFYYNWLATEEPWIN